VQIQLRGVSGTLAHGVHVELLVIDHRRVHIEVEDASRPAGDPAAGLAHHPRAATARGRLLITHAAAWRPTLATGRRTFCRR
jgi:hypothetical protein